jgi:hypothetical protein
MLVVPVCDPVHQPSRQEVGEPQALLPGVGRHEEAQDTVGHDETTVMRVEQRRQNAMICSVAMGCLRTWSSTSRRQNSGVVCGDGAELEASRVPDQGGHEDGKRVGDPIVVDNTVTPTTDHRATMQLFEDGAHTMVISRTKSIGGHGT